VRLSAALVVLRRMVNELIVAFLDTLPLDPSPESKPFTPPVRSPLRLCSDPPVMRTSRCDDPSRCLLSPPAPRPSRWVSPLADAGDRGGDAPGPTAAYSQAASAKARCSGRAAVRLSAALVVLRRMVNELIVAFLGTLPLDPSPESKELMSLRTTPYPRHYK
jgi:hypothetical protein